MNAKNIPNHVGIILDGNGRWAKRRGLSRSEGHKAGFNNLKKLNLHIFNQGVKYLSVYAFSTENFGREKKEVDYLMNLLIMFCEKEMGHYKDKNIKVIFSGRRDNLSKSAIMAMDKLINATSKNDGGVFNICFNYGSQSEIVDATKRVIEDVENKLINIDKIDEDMFSRYMYNDLPPLDFVIRTSGEQRLSNFMLWQASYAELYFPHVHFPDFDEQEFDKAMIEYTKRDRRFGGINYEN